MDWPHAPIHRLDAPGAYFITAGTFLKQHFFNTRQRLDSLQALLFGLAGSYKFLLQAWALFSNHYHFIVTAERELSSLAIMIRELHSRSAREVNRVDGVSGRRVWFQFWDKQLTFERSYLARLNYVNQNAVHHRLVAEATNYRRCSASWFEDRVSGAFAAAVKRFRPDRLKIADDFTPSECAGLPAL